MTFSFILIALSDKLFQDKTIHKDSISQELENWLVWARKKADWYDPFIEIEDELLKDVDRDTLTIKR